jgi:hypothetical protein
MKVKIISKCNKKMDKGVDLYVTYNTKHKCTELTERISGSYNCVVCISCRRAMFPKRVLFRTLRTNGTVIFNFIGRDGHGCFIQHNNAMYCKKCYKERRQKHDHDAIL